MSEKDLGIEHEESEEEAKLKKPEESVEPEVPVETPVQGEIGSAVDLGKSSVGSQEPGGSNVGTSRGSESGEGGIGKQAVETGKAFADEVDIIGPTVGK